MRIELRDGQWAELRERITHAVDKDIKKAHMRGRSDPVESFELDTVITRAFVRDWNVRDPDGAAISLTDADAIERAPDDIIEVLAKAAAQQWTQATVPNVPTPPSSDGSSSDNA